MKKIVFVVIGVLGMFTKNLECLEKQTHEDVLRRIKKIAYWDQQESLRKCWLCSCKSVEIVKRNKKSQVIFI